MDSHNVVQAGKLLIERRDFPKTVVDALEGFNVTHAIFPKPKEIITVKNTDSVLSAFKTLCEGKVLSVPVLDPSAGNVVQCVVSFLDFINYFLRLFTPEEVKRHKFAELLDRAHALERKTVKDMAGDIGDLDPPVSVRPECLARDAVKLMIQHHAHRVLVTDEEGKLVTIVTQSRMVELLAYVLDSVRERAERTLLELNLAEKGVHTINQAQPAIDAFSLMREKKVSAIAVVDCEGKLVDTISATDIRVVGFKLEYMDMLSKPAFEYTEFIRSKTSKPEFVVCCKQKDELAYALRLLMFWKMHRVFVVDEDRKPVSVLSLYDILALLLDRFAL